MLKLSSLLIATLLSANVAFAKSKTPKPVPMWTFLTKTFKGLEFNYTPFFINPNGITFFSSGGDIYAGNGYKKHEASFSQVQSSSLVIKNGPDPIELNYFRGSSSDRAKIAGSSLYEQWLIVEHTRCYLGGCDQAGSIYRMGVYRSLDSGKNWQFQGLMTVNGAYYSQWDANDALIFDPTKPAVVDLINPANNRFIKFGDKSKMLVSADGVNYKSVAMTYPYPNDSPVFVSIAKTPYGFHMVAGDKWDNTYGVKTIHHLFSTDLKTWKVLEDRTAMDNPNFYKGVHLRYDSASKRLYAYSGCGSKNACGYLGYLAAKAF